MNNKEQSEAKKIANALRPISDHMASMKWIESTYFDNERFGIEPTDFGYDQLQKIWDAILPVMPSIRIAADADAFLFWLRLYARQQDWSPEPC